MCFRQLTAVSTIKMKVLCLLLSLTAIATSAPSTVHGGTGYVGTGVGAGVGFLATKTIDFRPTEVVSEKVLDVAVPPPPPPAPAKKTVIERTVIPQYVEKTVRVPTYIERTIRVPAYVHRVVKVQVAPSVVEKEISHEEVPIPEHVATVRPISGVGVHKVVSAGGGYIGAPAGYSYGGIFNIPIQTLSAVNGLLTTIARGLTGGVSFSAGKAFAY